MKWDSDPNRYDKRSRDNQIKDNREYYNMRRKNPCTTIKECVDDAVKTGNHVMFARMFIHGNDLKSQERFRAWCEKLREDKKIRLSKICFVSTNDWRNPAISPDAMKDMSPSSKSNWQTGKTAIPRDNLIQLALFLGMSSDEADDLLLFMNERRLYPLDVVDAVMMYYLDYFWSANAAQNTKNSVTPERPETLEALESSEKIEKPEMSGGFERTEISEMPVSSGKTEEPEILGDSERTENPETPASLEKSDRPELIDYEYKLRTVKAEINEALAALDQQGLVWMRTPKRYQSKKAKENPDAAYTYAPAFGSELGIDIVKELSVLKKVYEKNTDLSETGTSDKPTLTKFMTQYFRKRIKEARSFSEYFDLEKYREHPVFTERYYGYLKRTLDYLYDWSMYRKNFMTSGWILTGNVRYSEPKDQRKSFLDPTVEKIFNSFEAFREEKTDASEKEKSPASAMNNSDDCPTADNSETSSGGLEGLENAKKSICPVAEKRKASFREKYYKTCFMLVHGIETMDVIIQDDPAYSVKELKEIDWTVSRKYLEGEEVPGNADAVKWMPTGDGAFAASRMDEEESITRFTAKEMNNKKAIMEYAIATGHEDALGNYLCLAGYWKTDWYVEDGWGSFEPDRLDALFLYAMYYRDKLIDSVCSKSGRGLDKTVERGGLRSGFPMRELLTIISRDISYAYTVCENDIYEWDEDAKKTPINNAGSKGSKSTSAASRHEEEFADMRENMLFPIAWTTKENKYSNDRVVNPYYRRKKISKGF